MPWMAIQYRCNMQIQQFITNFRETLKQETSKSTHWVSDEMLHMIDSCLLSAYLKEVPDYDIIIDD